MLNGRLVPDENVRQGGANEICDQAENPSQHSMLASISFVLDPMKRKNHDLPDDQEEAEELAVDVVARPGAHIRILGRLEIDQLCGRLVDEGL